MAVVASWLASVCASALSAQPLPGPVWSCGRDNYGQLGIGDTGDAGDRTTPVRTLTLSAVAAVEAGLYHTLALDDQGGVWAWGYNWVGQVGDGTTTDRREPVAVIGLGACKAVAAGNYHSLAIAADGTLWGWGRNYFGQLGDGSTIDRAVPVQVVGVADVVAVSGGRFHTVALTSDGSVWTWGRNLNGQLGDGTTTTRLTPVQVTGVSGVIAVAAGYSHTVVAKSDGTVWTWGRNNYGQIGDGSTTDRLSPVQVTTLSCVASVAAGYYHSLAVKDDGTVAAWGRNLEGQLGDGSTTNRLRPVAMSTVTGVESLSAGSNHTLILAGGGCLWACGYNENGQLGDGTIVNRTQPVRVAGVGGKGYLPNVVAMACGGYHSLAIINCTATFGVDWQPPEGGTLTYEPQKDVYDYGDLITVEAVPETGWSLSGWGELPSGADGGMGSAPEAAISFNVLCDSLAVADFAEQYYDFELLVSPGGQVTGDPPGTYRAGTTVSLHAEPDEGYRFAAWFVNDEPLADTEHLLMLLLDGDKNVEAVFARQCVLTVVDGSGSGVYDEGTEVEIVADWPEDHFDRWVGDVATVTDVLSATTVITVDGHYTVTAVATSQLAIEVRTGGDLDWVYQNTPNCLSRGGHTVSLEVVVLDYAGNDSVDLTVAKAPGSGLGEVSVADDPLGNPLVRLIVGSMRTDGVTGAGALTLVVAATGNVWGQASASVPFVVRRLGDVDGNGGAEPTDLTLMILCLNGMAPPTIPPRAFDLDANGGAEPTDLGTLINVLNGIPVG
ncbi:MAG: hypothetical protein JXL80_11255 [Planctomycetes bacterium]|nr:hypothetical protein [Planctomycetota bacterium]